MILPKQAHWNKHKRGPTPGALPAALAPAAKQCTQVAETLYAGEAAKTRTALRTFTSSFRYTFSLFGAVRWTFLLRPPASKSMPCDTMQASAPRRTGAAR